MQVLVVLGVQPGQVFSRDDLIELCWEGRIVGDNAINRVISQLRHALAEISVGAVWLETITKVGFRLVIEPTAEGASSTTVEAQLPPLKVPLGRRKLLACGGLITATLGAGGWAAIRSRQHTPDPRAVNLLQQADLLMKSAREGTTRQAIRYLEQAVEIDPDYADGWGLLAATYRHSLDGFSAGERKSYPRMLGSAAKRALELDPNQADAQLALAVMYPFFGRWNEVEPELRNIQSKFPDHWYANGQLSLLLMDAGRFNESLRFRLQSLRSDPNIPVSRFFLVMNELAADRYHQADASIDRALGNWPGHPVLWQAGFRLLLETDRPNEAAAFARDPRFLPDGLPPTFAEGWAKVADAIATQNPAAIAKARDHVISNMEAPDSAAGMAPILAMLGEPELALVACEGFFFGGRFANFGWPAPDRYSNRPTSLLFFPSLLALRERPQFEMLLQRTGLEAYWEQSGSQPDFRRG